MKLRALIILMFAAQISVLSGYIFLYWKPQYSQHIEERIVTSESRVSSAVASALVSPLLKRQLSQVYEMLDEQLSVHRLWKEVMLKNIDGRTLYPLSAAMDESYVPPENLLYIEQDIVLGEQLLGKLKIGVDMSEVIAVENSALSQLSWMIMGLLLLSSAVLIFLMDRTIRKPVSALVEATRKLQKGRFGFALPTSRNNEIASLVSAFSEMSMSLNNTQKELIDNATRVQTVLNTVSDGVITIDAKGVIVSVNQSMQDIFGYSEDEMVGNRVNMLMDDAASSTHDGYLMNYRDTKEQISIGIGRQLDAIRKNGEVFPIEISVSDVTIEGNTYFVGTIRDISERIKVDRIKKEFISTVSHELRTPITSIKGSLDLLLAGVVGNVGEEEGKMLRIALSNSKRLLVLINEILDMEKMESGKIVYDFGEHGVNSLLVAAVESNAAYATQHKIQLEVNYLEDDITVYVDIDRMMQVLSNLISNACKFSDAGCVVHIGAERQHDTVRIYVKDHGCGVPESFRDRIFMRFARADGSDSRKAYGTGLGLSITQSLVKGMHGEVNFESTPGKGSTFYCVLPLNYAVAQEKRA
ncbi:MAG: PAS domain S-box protein [Gammaproteobacteria bacterium]|nr:PAS domain S-box protein [Gammaproteobacteria bacterium]